MLKIILIVAALIAAAYLAPVAQTVPPTPGASATPTATRWEATFTAAKATDTTMHIAHCRTPVTNPASVLERCP